MSVLENFPLSRADSSEINFTFASEGGVNIWTSREIHGRQFSSGGKVKTSAVAAAIWLI